MGIRGCGGFGAGFLGGLGRRVGVGLRRLWLLRGRLVVGKGGCRVLEGGCWMGVVVVVVVGRLVGSRLLMGRWGSLRWDRIGRVGGERFGKGVDGSCRGLDRGRLERELCGVGGMVVVVGFGGC